MFMECASAHQVEDYEVLPVRRICCPRERSEAVRVVEKMFVQCEFTLSVGAAAVVPVEEIMDEEDAAVGDSNSQCQPLDFALS